MDINSWLANFEKYWLAHDINGVVGLFDERVVYYETPFLKIEGRDKLVDIWQPIKNQDNISLAYEVFSSSGDKHSVIWKLKYNDEKGVEHNHAGTYLIELNNQGQCIYFHHCCE